MRDDLQDFTGGTFTHDGTTRQLYRLGEGPAVIVMAEIPGITPEVAHFARRVAGIGCTAVLPVLFGVPGQSADLLGVVRAIVPACVSREFAAFAAGRTAPVTTWLRALAADEWKRASGPGVGAVGMCFTGGFALGMMVDDHLLAPVLSQPSLPLAIGAGKKAALPVSAEDLAAIKERLDGDDGLCVMGLRFTHDRLAPAERFETLRRELGDRFVGVEIDSSPGNRWGHPKAAHSVLTEHLVDEPGQPTQDALNQVLDFFRDRLLVG